MNPATTVTALCRNIHPGRSYPAGRCQEEERGLMTTAASSQVAGKAEEACMPSRAFCQSCTSAAIESGNGLPNVYTRAANQSIGASHMYTNMCVWVGCKRGEEG